MTMGKDRNSTSDICTQKRRGESEERGRGYDGNGANPVKFHRARLRTKSRRTKEPNDVESSCIPENEAPICAFLPSDAFKKKRKNFPSGKE